MTALRELIEAVERGEWLPLQALVALGGDGPKIDARRAFDGDVNAALALMAAVLPNEEGWWWSIGHHDKEAPRYNAEVWRTGPNCPFYRQNPAMADTPARALLLATLRAMEAKP